MTVLRHFGLKEQPFGVTPDPRFLYATSTHREALASLLYGLESGLGFVSLIAQPGMGKTTLLFEALRRIADSTRSVFLFQTISNPHELVHSLLMDLGERDVPANLVEMQSRLNEVLVNHQATGRRLVVVIDEAQNLNTVVLEAVRMLSNFETAGQKLLQIILAGQPQLAEKLVSPELLQLRQRISIFAHLDPLQATEVTAYVQHRLRIAGCDLPETLFSRGALAAISRASEGIPRNINSICFNALSLGYALQKSSIDADVIEEVLRDRDVRVEYVAPPTPTAFHEQASKESMSQRPARSSRFSVLALGIAGLICVALSLLVGIEIGGISGRRGPAAIRQLPEDATFQQHAAAPVVPAASTARPVADPATTDPAHMQSGTTEPGLPAAAGSAEPGGAAVAGQGMPDTSENGHPASVTPGAESQGNVPAVNVAPEPSPASGISPASPSVATGNMSAAQMKTAPAAETQFVLARSGQTMVGICKEVFRKCAADTLRRMIELNPGIPDPNRIMPGQRITVPAVPPS